MRSGQGYAGVEILNNTLHPERLQSQVASTLYQPKRVGGKYWVPCLASLPTSWSGTSMTLKETISNESLYLFHILQHSPLKGKSWPTWYSRLSWSLATPLPLSTFPSFSTFIVRTILYYFLDFNAKNSLRNVWTLALL